MTKQTPAPGHNTATDPEAVSFYERIRNIDERIDEISADHNEKKRIELEPVKADRKALIDEACEDLNLPKSVVNAQAKRFKLLRRAEQVGDNLDEENKTRLEDLQASLGDYGSTPLGQAALDTAA